MDKGVFELSQKVSSLKRKIKNLPKQCEELSEQVALAQKQVDELTPLQYSEDPKERALFIDAHCKRVFLSAELAKKESLLTIAKYELNKINEADAELRQQQPE